MKNNPKKIIIDTNLWISFLISKNFSQLDEIILSGKCILIFSEELLNEFLSVITRPKFKKFFSKADIEDLIETIDRSAEFIEVTSVVNLCRDEKDNFLLSLSKDAEADFLITGDNDLLDLKQVESTRIITFSDFIKNYL